MREDAEEMIASFRGIDNLEYQPLDETQTSAYLNVVVAEGTGVLDTLDKEMQGLFTYDILRKRVEVLELQDKVGVGALAVATILGDGNPGKTMLALVDMLNLHDETGRKVTSQDVSLLLYPHGFYTDEQAMSLIDTYLKKGKVHNHKVY